jgi:hypothetical protein
MKDVANDLEATLREATPRLRAILDREAAVKPAPNAWSPKEIMGHLIDSAANNHQRFVRLQLQEHLDLPGYEQDGWVRVQRYQELPWLEIIDLWRVYNHHLAQVIRTVDPGALRHTWVTPEGKTVDLEFVMRDYVVHMKHHLDDIFG